jgi:hypothetical protein
MESVDHTPMRGELALKDRRSWKTWQLGIAVLVAFLIGLAINYKAVGGGAESANSPSYKLPAASGSSATTTTAAGSASSGSTTTTRSSTTGGSKATTTTTSNAAGGSTTTSSAPSSSSSTGAPGPARVLLGPTQLQGNWTSPAFTTTAAGWNIGYAFRCTPAPASGPSFEVFVTPVGGAPTGTPAINQTGPSGQSVTTQNSLGAQTLVVQAPSGCTWVVKVTGS